MTDQTFDPSKFAKPQRISAQAPASQTFDPQGIKARIEAESQRETDLLSAPLGPLKTWSFSALMNYENCPYAQYLKKVEKAPDPSGPAAERGTLIHECIENYIQGETTTLIPELTGNMKKVNLDPFKSLIDRLQLGFAEGNVEVEGDWGFTRQWQPTGWHAPDIWARVKLDAIEFEDAERTSAQALDWKSGRKFGNELKHNQQGMTYAIAAFMKYPSLQFIRTRFVYVDQHDELENNYTRDRAMLLKPMIDKRANRMTTATTFPPKPSLTACRWCPHKDIQEGEEAPRCSYAYQDL